MMRVLASVVALCIGASAASAASYKMFDHDAGGNAGSYDYGLRMEGAPGSGASDYWSFEDLAGSSTVTLSVDVAGGSGSVFGTMRHNEDDSDWDLNLNLTGVTSLAGIGAGAESFGALAYSGTLSNGTTTYNLVGKGKNVKGTSYQWTYFTEDPGGVDWRAPNISAGWVSSLDGGTSMFNSGTNDFIGEMVSVPGGPLAPVPLPAAGWLMVGGLAAFGMVRRRKHR